ncbi:MAG: hypothetical protein DHS20C17_33890 [Cyclobacteriaceae bacterium]|nr:MAG: hypothetical protein DHS20C17_33890 [Cyclobacteriaceae bacterium]
MIPIPKYSQAFEFENNFYLTSHPSRIGKFIIHYELYKKVKHLPGAIVECGIFKGASFIRFASFVNLLEKGNREVIGFDIFGEFPKGKDKDDLMVLDNFLKAAGSKSIGEDQLWEVLKRKNLDDKIQLIKGDINHTIPNFVQDNPHLQIALINLDTDIYQPSLTVLEYLFPRLVPGGILVLDDYGIHSGETAAVDEYFKRQHIDIHTFPYAENPSYIIKK